MKLKHFFIVGFSCLFLNLVFATPVTVQNDFYSLTVKHKPIVFVINNISRHSIWLDRHFGKTHPPMSAGWSSEIDGGKWSALVLQHGQFTLSCTRTENNQIKILNCKNVIKIYPMYFKDLNSDSFSGWLSENHNLFALYHEILQRKIWPKGFYKLFF